MKVFFLITPASRERQWDTVRNQPQGIEALTPPGVAPLGSRKTYAAATSWKGRLKQLATIWLPMPNVTFRADAPADADLVYTWSKFPLRIGKPFVIELDNPYALAYYSRRGLRLLRPLLRRLLLRARHVAFMSEACGATFRELFGALPVPQSVSYPFMAARSAARIPSHDGTVRFLFVGLDFRIKGGPELVEAWRRADLPNATLRVVTTVTNEMRRQYADVPGLVLEEAQGRDALMRDVFPDADVFVYPTFFDSFGVVLLEALSFGLGIIATNVYATPELVRGNGVLLEHPVLAPRMIAGQEIVSPVEEHFSTFVAKHLGPGVLHESLVGQLVAAFRAGARDHESWKERSESLFRERFAPEAWQENMRRILS